MIKKLGKQNDMLACYFCISSHQMVKIFFRTKTIFVKANNYSFGSTKKFTIIALKKMYIMIYVIAISAIISCSIVRRKEAEKYALVSTFVIFRILI